MQTRDTHPYVSDLAIESSLLQTSSMSMQWTRKKSTSTKNNNGFAPLPLFLKADGEWTAHPLVPFAFCLFIYASWPGIQAADLPMLLSCFISMSCRYPYSPSFNLTLGSFQPIGSHNTGFSSPYQISGSFTTYCFIRTTSAIFGLPLKVLSLLPLYLPRSSNFVLFLTIPWIHDFLTLSV